MTYYLAPPLVILRAELDAEHPNRDRRSDGWIGDTAHGARPSDHNPDPTSGGIVRALDVDVDGIDLARLVYVATHDPSDRVANVITNGRLWVRGVGWAPYSGSNKHTQHAHISVRKHAPSQSSRAPWGYRSTPSAKEDDMQADERAALFLIKDAVMMTATDSWGTHLNAHLFDLKAKVDLADQSVTSVNRNVLAEFAALRAVLTGLQSPEGSSWTAEQLTDIATTAANRALEGLGDALTGDLS